MQSGRRGIQSASIATALSLSLALFACGSTRSGAPFDHGHQGTDCLDEHPRNDYDHDPRPNVCRRAKRLPRRMGGVRARIGRRRTRATRSWRRRWSTRSYKGYGRTCLADKKAGMVGRGTTTLHPKIIALSATTATVVDCAHSTAELLYATTGKPVPPVTPPENDGVRATLVLSGSTWKVSKQTVTEGTCAPGS